MDGVLMVLSLVEPIAFSWIVPVEIALVVDLSWQLVALAQIGLSGVSLMTSMVFDIGCYWWFFFSICVIRPRNELYFSDLLFLVWLFYLCWFCLHQHGSHDVTIPPMERFVDAALCALHRWFCGMA